MAAASLLRSQHLHKPLALGVASMGLGFGEPR